MLLSVAIISEFYAHPYMDALYVTRMKSKVKVAHGHGSGAGLGARLSLRYQILIPV